MELSVMAIRLGRALLLNGSIFSLLCCFDQGAQAQVTLPEIKVQAPSPIVRRAPARAPTAAAAAETAEQVVPPVQTGVQPGTLIVVTDQFATVTVVPNEEIRRNGASTLGDLLFSKPGITGSEFAPGAASRPIIRGLDVNRVGILENGIGGGGASDLGEDHFVPQDPLVTNQVEVIRGPATLRYGSTAIGGVVEGSNNRIPEAIPYRGFGAEFRGGATTVDNGIDGAVLLDVGGGNFALHADAFGRQADDYRIPSYPYLFDPTQPFDGRQPNSALRTNGGSVGGSYIFESGFFGLALTQHNAAYHIPGIEPTEHNTRIDAHQTTVLSKGEWRAPTPFIDAVRFWGGVTDYKHDELGLADPADPTTDGVRQTFTNKEQEGRIEVQLAPVNLPFAALTSAFGVQAGHQDLTAPGDAPGPFSGLYDPNSNRRIAAFLFNEFKFSETLKAQLAGRIEHVKLDGMMPVFPSDFVPDGSPLVSTAQSPQFTPKSASAGLIQNLPWGLVGSVTAQYVERAPKPAELFSRGPHDATGTFDIGNPNLAIEIARSIEAGLRRAVGPLRFEATAYYTKFAGFIYRNLSGLLCNEEFDTCGDPAGELQQAVYQQRDATFRGAEVQAQYDVAPLWMGVWGVEGQYDIVRATFEDGSNVPRIPPQRLGGGLFWRDAHWLARVNLLHAFAQNDIAPNETPTAGYNLLKAELSYTKKLNDRDTGIREFTAGIVGNNLLNEDIRASTSFTKDQVLLPGLSVRLFATVRH
jgi:iron complex outermembrane receptor protein